MPRGRYKPMTGHEIHRAKALREAGLSWNAIGSRLGFAMETVQAALIPGFREARQEKINTARARREGRVFGERKPRVRPVISHAGLARARSKSHAKGLNGEHLRRARQNALRYGDRPEPVKISTDLPPDARRISILELENSTCRYPLGTPGTEGFAYCGAPGADFAAGRPYCPTHHGRCRDPRPLKRITVPHSPKPTKTPAEARGLSDQPA